MEHRGSHPRVGRRPRRRAAGHVGRPPGRRRSATRPRSWSRKDDGTDVWDVPGPADAEHRAQRRRRAPARGVRDRADVVRRHARPAATTSTSASATWTPTASSARCASRRCRASAGSCGPSTADKESPRRCCRPTTTGTSTSGAAPTRAASSRCRCPRSGTRRRWPPRSGGWRRRAATPSRSRRTPRSSATRASTASTGTRSGRPAPTRARSCACTSARRRRW